MMISSTPLYLIAAAMGYQTLTNATQQSSPSRRSFGRILGMVILAVSLAMVIIPFVQAYCISGCPLSKGMCGR